MVEASQSDTPLRRSEATTLTVSSHLIFRMSAWAYSRVFVRCFAAQGLDYSCALWRINLVHSASIIVLT